MLSGRIKRREWCEIFICGLLTPHCQTLDIYGSFYCTFVYEMYDDDVILRIQLGEICVGM